MQSHDPDTSQPADRELLDRFLVSRSEPAFLALYDRHSDGMFRFAARLVGRAAGHEPSELIQEAWLRALEGFPSFRWRSSLRTWLCGIVLNRWRELRQHEERSRRLSVIEGQGEPQGTGLPLNSTAVDSAAVDRVAVERALAGLPDGYREVLLLHDVEGYTHEEIAQHFGIVEGTSKSQLHRARRALREALGLTEKERA